MFTKRRRFVLKAYIASRIGCLLSGKALGKVSGPAAAGVEPRGAVSRRQEILPPPPPPISRTNDTVLLARSARLETHPSSPSVACWEISAPRRRWAGKLLFIISGAAPGRGDTRNSGRRGLSWRANTRRDGKLF